MTGILWLLLALAFAVLIVTAVGWTVAPDLGSPWTEPNARPPDKPVDGPESLRILRPGPIPFTEELAIDYGLIPDPANSGQSPAGPVFYDSGSITPEDLAAFSHLPGGLIRTSSDAQIIVISNQRHGVGTLLKHPGVYRIHEPDGTPTELTRTLDLVGKPFPPAGAKGRFYSWKGPLPATLPRKT